MDGLLLISEEKQQMRRALEASQDAGYETLLKISAIRLSKKHFSVSRRAGTLHQSDTGARSHADKWKRRSSQWAHTSHVGKSVLGISISFSPFHTQQISASSAYCST